MILLCLFLTLFIESAVLLLLKERRPLVFGFLAAVNVFTNLSLNLALALWQPTGAAYVLGALALEVAILVAEAALLGSYFGNRRRGVRYSVACNLSSGLLGILLLQIL